MEEVGRNRQRYAWPDGRKCRVRHHVSLPWLDERYARIFAATAAVRLPFVVRFRLERDAAAYPATYETCGIGGKVRYRPDGALRSDVQFSLTNRRRLKCILVAAFLEPFCSLLSLSTSRAGYEFTQRWTQPSGRSFIQ